MPITLFVFAVGVKLSHANIIVLFFPADEEKRIDSLAVPFPKAMCDRYMLLFFSFLASKLEACRNGNIREPPVAMH